MRDYRLVRQPMQSIDASVLKRAAPECRYVVLNSDGQVALSGVARPQEDLTFRVEVDGRLPPGRYTVMAEILVNGNALNPQITLIRWVIVGVVTYSLRTLYDWIRGG